MIAKGNGLKIIVNKKYFYIIKHLIQLIINNILIIYLIKIFLFEKLCQKCSKDANNKECIKCPFNIIFSGLKIHDNEETLNEILKNKRSISRFGDGEFISIFGLNIGFQNYSKTLSKRLKEILNSNEKGLLIGLNIPYESKILRQFKDEVKDYYRNFLESYKFPILNIINKNKTYYSSTLTRFYIDYKSKKGVPNYVKKLQKIWENKDIVIIEGEKSRLGIGNNLFNNTKSIKRIICPAYNAFDKYNIIINTVVNNVKKNKLILISLGPTATLLSYDLYKFGYQALDIGHIDIEYEWYIRKAKKKSKIENKCVIEVSGNDSYIIIKDKSYYDEIIKRIY